MVMTKTTNYVKKIRVAIYVRVSTKEQAMEGYSIGEQTDRLKKFCEAHDWCIVKVYTDAGHSGADTDRPALQDMIMDIEEGRIDKVLVYKLDRLSRSQKDTLELIENVFLKRNVDFESMCEKLDTSTAHGRAMIGILAAFAQLEREMITERMSMGMYARIKEGKWRGVKPPFGYDYEPSLDKLVINEYESMIVKEIFQSFTEGKSVHQIQTNMLNTGKVLNNGHADKRGIRYILRNKTYCGYIPYKGELIKGLHDAIISEETYDQAQVILDENKRKFEETGIKTGVSAICTNLGGLLFCAKCGARYSKCRTGNNKWGYKIYYGCYSRHKKIKNMIKDPSCRNKYYDIPELDNIIISEIQKLSVDPNYIETLKKNTEKTEEMLQISAIEHQIKSIDQQLSRFMDLYGLGKYDMKQLDEKMQPLNAQKLKLQTELKRLRNDSEKMTEEEVIEIVSNFKEAFEHGDLQDRRSIIEALINRIDIDDDNITIHWNFI